jgi:hypothetical protein
MRLGESERRKKTMSNEKPMDKTLVVQVKIIGLILLVCIFVFVTLSLNTSFEEELITKSEEVGVWEFNTGNISTHPYEPNFIIVKNQSLPETQEVTMCNFTFEIDINCLPKLRSQICKQPNNNYSYNQITEIVINDVVHVCYPKHPLQTFEVYEDEKEN